MLRLLKKRDLLMLRLLNYHLRSTRIDMNAGETLSGEGLYTNRKPKALGEGVKKRTMRKPKGKDLYTNRKSIYILLMYTYSHFLHILVKPPKSLSETSIVPSSMSAR